MKTQLLSKTVIGVITSVVSLVAVGTPVVAAEFGFVGNYLDGAYNVGQRTQLRYFAVVVNGRLDHRSAEEVAAMAARRVAQDNRTHERLWDYNYREVILRGDQFLLIGWEDAGGYAFLATDGFRRWVSHGLSGVNQGTWERRDFRTSRGDLAYLQVGHERGRIQFQFDGR
jgi:hypothetical protein